ncbi:MAG: hypothetical protein SCK57_05275 [Bacillota bacterium]|nr:hypothetical protein [Bacillota bacterium]MDW7677052.1 hypothetical protein [Bacillota bacterium]
MNWRSEKWVEVVVPEEEAAAVPLAAAEAAVVEAAVFLVEARAEVLLETPGAAAVCLGAGKELVVSSAIGRSADRIPDALVEEAFQAVEDLLVPGVDVVTAR